jgi:hypothetical protein
MVVLLPVLLVVYWLSVGETVYESVSPSNAGSVILHQISGFRGTTASLSVRDYSVSGSKPLHIGYIGFRGHHAYEAVWSQDGSLVAIRDETEWLAAYDFAKHSDVRVRGDSSKQLSRAIQKLLTARGGVGQEILSNKINFNDVARHVWWWEDFTSQRPNSYYVDIRPSSPSPKTRPQNSDSSTHL